MTDFQEEQRNEIEALESIYPSELEILETEPFHAFTIDVKADAGDQPEDEQMSVKLKFTYEDVETLVTALKEQVQENLGMVMIFTLVSAATEWLNQHTESVKFNKNEALRLQKEKDEEAERVKFEGTRVTVESFMAWKSKFDAEMAEIRNKDKILNASGKLTGRELFEKDKNLIDSDLQFMQEGEEDVKVDESLFQELEDLDLEELDEPDEVKA
ncbi:hypothetical protein MTO96_006469 [Rhipicephalus appendiculatus]